MQFSDLRLSEPILRALVAEGYNVPTPIQAQAIPHVLEGKDILGVAQTGTGKTAAFALPILDRLSASDAAHPLPLPSGEGRGEGSRHVERASHSHAALTTAHSQRERGPKRPIRCLVLSPTRELALQIGDSFRAYGKFTGLRHTVIFGGVGQNPQVQAIRHGVDVLVATPGRLLDLMNQGFIDLRHVECFVLDEADRMLDMGFIHDIRRVIPKLPAKRQNLMFSATMPREIADLAHTILRHPVKVEVTPVASTVDKIEQSVYFVEKKNKPVLLAHFIKSNPVSRALVFTRTKHGADRVVRQLDRYGIRSEAIHGNKSQNARQRALANFKSGKTHILIASDIAARGIDIDDISHVVNYDLSNEPETYVHRIGRTARAGASGVAVSFCDSEERAYLQAIQRLIKREIPVRKDHPQYPARSPVDEYIRGPASSSDAGSTAPRPHREKHAHTSPRPAKHASRQTRHSVGAGVSHQPSRQPQQPSRSTEPHPARQTASRPSHPLSWRGKTRKHR